MSSVTAATLRAEVMKCIRPNLVAGKQKFFQAVTKGQYGYPDVFIACTNPDLTAIMKKNFFNKTTKNSSSSSSLSSPINKEIITPLLRDRVHEVRLLGWFILREESKRAFLKFQRLNNNNNNNKKASSSSSSSSSRQELEEACKSILEKNSKLLLEHKTRLRNWDETDTVAGHVLGNYLISCNNSSTKKSANGGNNGSRWQLLDALTEPSQPLMVQRLGVIATHALITKEKSEREIILLSKKLMDHEHDLIHKGCGWMLREMGIVKPASLKSFLRKYAAKMPRTALRYSIEKLPAKERLMYLNMQ